MIRKLLSLILPAAISLLLSIVLMRVIFADAPMYTLAAADLGAGDYYEVNAAANGELVISDYDFGRLMRYHPATNVYTRYSGLGTVLDAQADHNGAIWWVSGDTGFGKLDPTTGAVTEWSVSAILLDTNLSGIAFDTTNHVWMTQFIGAQLFRFAPAAGQWCTYTVPGNNNSWYVRYRDGGIWLASVSTPRDIWRLNTSTNEITRWDLPIANASPLGLAIDEQGHIWWADQSKGYIGQLTPASNTIITYTLAQGKSPQSVVVSNGVAWYTEATSTTIGRLDAATANGISQTVATSSQTLSPVCSTISPRSSYTAPSTIGTLNWASSTITPTYDTQGWTVFTLPTGAAPYGIALQGAVWATDSGQSKLLKLSDNTPMTINGQLGIHAVASRSAAPHGDAITYTYYITYSSTNASPASSLVVTDDHCADVQYSAGDVNLNLRLDVNETWQYSCIYTIPAHTITETNPLVSVATVNGLDANEIALATRQASVSVTILEPRVYLPVILSNTGNP